mgnify:CR=1 FL=1
MQSLTCGSLKKAMYHFKGKRMNKTDMITIYQSMEYKLIKQQEENIARTGMADEELTRKIELVRAKIANSQVGMYGKAIEADRAFMADKLKRHGIFI